MSLQAYDDTVPRHRMSFSSCIRVQRWRRSVCSKQCSELSCKQRRPDNRRVCRDPNLLDTLKAYDDTVPFLLESALDADALTKTIVGTFGDIDAYELPDARGSTAFMRHLLGVTDEERQQRREEVLGTTNKDFVEFADALAAVAGPEARVVAVTSKGDLEAAEAKQPGVFEKVTTIM